METLYAVLRFLAQDPTGWIIAVATTLAAVLAILDRRTQPDITLARWSDGTTPLRPGVDRLLLSVGNPSRNRMLTIAALRVVAPRGATLAGVFPVTDGLQIDVPRDLSAGAGPLWVVRPGGAALLAVDVASLSSNADISIELRTCQSTRIRRSRRHRISAAIQATSI